MSNRSMNPRIAIIMMLCVLSAVPTAYAGSLEPSGPPASTMKSLDNVLPTWSRKLPAAERFVVLADFNNEAVLDKETGLVWEKNPTSVTVTWNTAVNYCISNLVGGSKGWRLPTVMDLMSLVDHTQVVPALPSGHPFTNVQLNPIGYYWTATTYINDSNQAYTVDIGTTGGAPWYPKTTSKNYWCVRGGVGVNLYQ